MKTINNKRKFLALLLSLMMVSSVGAAFSSCVSPDDSSSSSSTSSSSSSSSSSSTKVDKGTIKNSNFDFTTLSDTTLIGTSITGWSRTVNDATAGNAATSDSKSGVINVEKWDDMVLRNYTDEELNELSDSVAAARWDAEQDGQPKLTVGDKLAYYEIWKARSANKDKTISDEDEGFEKYQSFNVKLVDLPYQDKYLEPKEEGSSTMVNKGNLQEDWTGKQWTEQDLKDANPGTHYDGSDTNAPDSHILMLHNNDTVGTAQKATSTTTVTVAAGSAAKFSVWVKTADLVAFNSNKEEQPAVDKGAYISVSHSVGSKSVDDYTVENIDTQAMGVTDNNGWKQYTFYLNGSSFVDTTFKIVLGLGQGGEQDKYGYVNGYAYFDDITYETIKPADFATATVGVPTINLDSEDRVLDASNDVLAMDYSDSNWTSANDVISAVDDDSDWTPTKSSDNSNVVSFDETKAGSNLIKYYKSKDALKTEATANDADKYLKTVFNNQLADDKFYNDTAKNAATLLILSANGAPYTVTPNYTFEMDTDYAVLSFYVKSYCLSSATGAGVTLKQILGSDVYSTKATFSAINTDALDGVTIGDVEDVYDGWQRCYFFLEKDADFTGTAEFQLVFNYGPTDITKDTAKTQFSAGYAAFTNFEYIELTKSQYECAQSGDYAQTVTFASLEETLAESNSSFDTTAGTPSDAIEKGLANLLNYKGVYSDSAYVTTPNAGGAADANREINANKNAGLVNKEYFIGLNDKESYFSTNTEAWLNGIKAGNGSTATEVWENVFGDATQPLLIWNDGNAKSYGYIGTATTMSSDYTAISVRVKTSSGAKASVYLIDSETLQPITVNRVLTYWYDDDGNVMTGDPESKDSVVAFRRDLKTGLYKANAKTKGGNYVWSAYSALSTAGFINDNIYFANLSAYADKALNDYKDGDILYANEDSQGQQYHKDNSDWNGELFYNRNGKWYTDKEGGYQVVDFNAVSDITNLEARYDAINGNEYKLAVENIETDGEWRIVTFYVHKGAVGKNYRLEVWSSGTRAGDANRANSYVLFDTNAATVDSSRFSTLVDLYKYSAVKSFEGVFSYYDTDKFVRYDASYDTNKVGDLFETSFKASNYSENVAYLYYEDDVEGTYRYLVFADYSLSDVRISETNSPDTDDDTDNDTPDTETTGEEMNVWLLASSIAVAVALIVAIGAIAGRRLWKFIQKKRAASVRPNIKKK